MIKQGRTMCALRYCAELIVKRIYFLKIKNAEGGVPYKTFTNNSRL